MKWQELLEDAATSGAHDENAKVLGAHTILKHSMSNEQIASYLRKGHDVALNEFKEGKYIIKTFYDTVELPMPPFIADSSKATRKSANTFNYYTLIIDNSAAWKHYPRRSRSFICSYVENTRNGVQYVVMPPDNTQLASANERDIWFSFQRLVQTFKSVHCDLEWFTDILNTIFKAAGLDRSDGSSSEFKAALDTLREKFFSSREVFEEFAKPLSPNQPRKLFMEGLWKHRNDMFAWLEDLLDPHLNDITLHDISELESLDPGDEIWFSGPALFVNEHDLRDIIKEFKL